MFDLSRLCSLEILFAFACVGLASCSGGRGSPTPTLELAAVHHGRLADVYGLERAGAHEAHALHAGDVLVGEDLPAGVDPATYEWLAPAGDRLQARILVRHPLGSPSFDAALAALQSGVEELDLAAAIDQRILARDAALELRFTGALGVDREFFAGNTRAVQLLHRTAGEVTQLPLRVVSRGDRLLLDPVGVDGAHRSALPRPTAGDAEQLDLALALDGPLRLPGLARGARGDSGTNAVGTRAVLVGFRARSGDGAVGFLRGGRAPRLRGELPFFLERVDAVPGGAVQEITVFKDGIAHDIDAGDRLAVVVRGPAPRVLETEVVVDPRDDDGRPRVQHVRVLVRWVAGLAQADPRHLPGYPADPQSPAGEAWLVAHAPRADLGAEFTAQYDSGATRDDLRYFVRFDPAPLPGSAAPNENVSPFAAAVLRFSAPIRLASVSALDSLFFGTRDLLDPRGAREFVRAQGIDPAVFSLAKYRTPHLVNARVFTQGGSRTVLRLEPMLGFYLDEVMRRADEGVPFANKQFRYFLHLVAGSDGITGANGAPLELGLAAGQPRRAVLPFSLDTRRRTGGMPLFPDNRVMHVARRYADPDEDEQPSYYQPSEVVPPGRPAGAAALPQPDVFGAVVYVGGALHGRPPARVRQVVDDLNQPAPPPQTSAQRFCPEMVRNEGQVAMGTAANPFNQGLQNPANRLGARLQTVWREIDMGLSRRDPDDFNLDVEALYLGAFRDAPIQTDEFPRVSAFLGHAEKRPENCVGTFSALPTFGGSGLTRTFQDNYAFDNDLTGQPVPPAPPHAAFVDRPWVLSAQRAVTDPSGVNRFHPLPQLEEPYFTWRDETESVQGGATRVGQDTDKSGPFSYQSYVLSPFLAGRGRGVSGTSASPTFLLGAWNNQREYGLASGQVETTTGGSVAALGLPLLLDMWTYPSPPDATIGLNGLQISLSVLSSPQPAYRAYSAGGFIQGQPVSVDPTARAWLIAAGGFTPAGARTRPDDNSVYWMMADFLKTTTVATAGFVDLTNPHRVPAAFGDPRLAPLSVGPLPAGRTVHFDYDADPVGHGLHPSSTLRVEFRGAGPVDPQPWRALVDGYAEIPDETNFPLDPLKSGDAGLRKFDDRPLSSGAPRNAWTHYYNKNVTDYTPDPNELMDPAFTARFAGPSETFTPGDVRYFNWRFTLRNNPALQSFAVSYRLE